MSLGFVIVRHVNNAIANEYWKESYRCIRKFYPEIPILIVDDNSNPGFLNEDIELTNVIRAQSEFKGCGELLGYYYFHKTHFVDKAIIIHDSVFMNSYVNFDQFGEFKCLWTFETHVHDVDKDILEMVSRLDSNREIIRLFLNKNKWMGCFGIMSVMSWEFLDRLNNRHNFFRNVFPYVRTRSDRMCMERIFTCVCQVNCPIVPNPPHIFGDISGSIWGWASSFEDYKSGRLSHLPIIKVWSGR